jgi:hypothetical protein
LIAIGATITGEHELAQRVVMSALPIVEQYGDDTHFGMLIDGIAAWATSCGYRRFGIVVGQGVLSREDDRNPAQIARELNHVAFTVHDDPVAANTRATAALQRAEEFGMVASRIVAVGHLLQGLYAVGRWQDALDLLNRHVADGRTDRLSWEAYVAVGSALLAYGREDPSIVIATIPAPGDSSDALVRAWGLMHEAVEIRLAGDRIGAAGLAVQSVRSIMAVATIGEDLPPVYGLAVDLLLDAGDTDSIDDLRKLTSQLEAVPLGQRFRLLHGHLLRARAYLSPNPVPGLRAATEVFAAMGANYLAARTRVELAARLADAGDARAATELLSSARPLLERIGAASALALADRVATSLSVAPAR